MIRFGTVIIIAAVVAIGTGCEKKAPTTAGAGGAGAGEAPAWVLASMPADPTPVAAAKKTAKEGDRVVLVGRIGGTLKPITAGSAVFTIMDPEVPSCAEVEGDNCPTPWDYCCETAESLAANNATVRVVGPDGKAVAADLGALGFKPLDEVVIVGVVGPRPAEAVFTINAEGIYRKGS